MGQLGPFGADEVMIANIEAIQARFQNVDQGGMAMSQVENTAVGMQVEKFFRAVQIVKKRTAAFAHDEIHAELPKKSHFPGRNVGLEYVDGIFSVHMDRAYPAVERPVTSRASEKKHTRFAAIWQPAAAYHRGICSSISAWRFSSHVLKDSGPEVAASSGKEKSESNSA